MLLLIDNYDSFSYNLYQMCGAIEPDIRVFRNDRITPDEIRKLHPDHILLSPGPGRPCDAGICEDVIREFAGKIPIHRRGYGSHGRKKQGLWSAIPSGIHSHPAGFRSAEKFSCALTRIS